MYWFRARSFVVGLAVGALAAGCGEPAPSSDDAIPPAADANTDAAVRAPVGPRPERAFADADLEALTPRRRMGWPVESVYLTSYFGWRVDPVTGRGTRLHRGIDLRGRPGDLVMSVAPGVVEFAGQDVLLGNLVVVDHGLGIRSFYGHLTDVLVHEGLPLEQGAAIGLVGNTGRSAAPHLHLSIQIHGVAVDPLALIGQSLHAPATLSRSLDEPAADGESGENDQFDEND